MQLGGAAIDGAAHEVGVAGLQLPQTQDAAGQDPVAEARRQVFEAGLHPVGEPLALVGVPAPGEAVLAGIAGQSCGTWV